MIALAGWIYSSNANSLTALHQDELQPALEKYVYQQYVQYKQEFPKFSDSFSGEVNEFHVLSYQSECSIVEARYTYIGLTVGMNYLLLKNNGSGWEVTDWAPAIDPITDDWVNKTLPIPFTCAGEL
ncbi:MAG: hypothetical protein ABI700_15610 [Chloroflexota bacterium]